MATPPPLSSTSPTRSSASPPPADLRHMQSNSVLISPSLSPGGKDRTNRHSIGLGGSRSPTSIPSSPTSVHSSSSAIFERDIEPVSPPATAGLHPTNPHRIPRSKTTETLESSVPSVLDSAAEILANMSDGNAEGVAVEAPAVSASRAIGSGWASPVLLRSRSPSPERKSLLLSRQCSVGSPPSIVTPTSAYFSTSSSVEGSPTTTTREYAPTLPIAGISISHPPSPTHVPTKRLSFMSYNDLLTSTPASTLPLSLLTSPGAVEPPPHIPALSSPSAAGSTTASLRGFPIDATGRNRDSIVLLDEVGGEWEREGLGTGLEERLEGLLNVNVVRT